ncbi:substrate-binding domain-containing protein [Streptomyces sp. JV176]|uniref:substrate-binding domain-containing protein n=1 Tax=Streptomyces sp. JV176 TaxID=858630 RepID=UPI002E7A311B|nr:substrate-binding domain-containing protein [Streptomyces sp. JV176]MEE1802085.1 substrate-binding domain-containing protein [Streptomyces sp. JV176]
MADDPPGPGARRTTIGLVTANIHLGVGATLWSGALAAAERDDVNLICFPGGPLRHGDVPRSALYELVGPARLDGVVCWSSTLGLPASGERAERLMRQLAHLPVVSLNQPLSGQEDTLTVDSYAGMREAVGHLVVHHGRRRLACIRGPLANPVSQERYRAYAAALGRHQVPHERALSCAAVDFGAGAGASAMRVLIEARGMAPGTDFDAVVACSDVLAADALRFLRARGVRVPEDVAVVGFNDSPEARLSDPPLTSVALPFAELGALAVDTLVARLRGTRPPARTAVPGTLVVRRSCGCHSPLVSPGRGDGTAASGTTADGTTAHGTAHAAPVPVRRPTEAELFAPLPRAAQGLAAAFHADTLRASTRRAGVPRAGAVPQRREGDPVGVFLPLLERLVGAHVRTAEDVAAWDGALARIRGPVIATLPAPRRARGELLLGRARLMVAEQAHRLLEYERWAQGQQSQRLRELGTDLTTVVDVEALTDVLERHTAAAGMPRCRLVLHDETWRRAERPVRGLARVLLTRGERPTRGEPFVRGRGAPPADAAFPASLLLPDQLLPGAGRFTLVLEPLHIGDDHLGFAVFDAGTAREAGRAGSLYRALGDQISAALKGIRLFDEVRRARDAAEQASRFKTRLLDQVTDELRTPVETMLRHTGADPRAALDLVRGDAVHLLRLIDNLLDLSRSEADDLHLTRRLRDPAPLLVRAFGSFLALRAPDGGGAASGAGRGGPGDAGRWTVAVPGRLPAIPVDGDRLGQIVTHLLSAAHSHAGESGRVALAARPGPAAVRITVTVTWTDRKATEGADSRSGEARSPAGLRAAEIGLATAGRLAMLHGGSLVTEHTGHRLRLALELPLPTPAGRPPPATAEPGGTLLVVAPRAPGAELLGLAGRHGLRLRPLTADDDIDALVEAVAPVAVAWDTAAAGPGAWPSAQHLHDHPRLRHTPFLLLGAEGQDLSRTLRALRPAGLRQPVIAVAASERSRKECGRLVAAALPDHPLRIAPDGTTALGLVAEEPPALLLLERTLPDMHALDVVDHLHHGGEGAPCPVVVLSDQGFTPADARRAGPHRALLLLDHAVLGADGAAALLARTVREHPPCPARSRTPVDAALVFLYEHYRHRISRWQIAEAAGVSADHLGRLFHQQYGVTVWEYLTRLRIQRAGIRLRHSGDSINSVARSVGFRDRAYFSRVFRRVTGEAPHAFRSRGPEERVG